MFSKEIYAYPIRMANWPTEHVQLSVFYRAVKRSIRVGYIWISLYHLNLFYLITDIEWWRANSMVHLWLYKNILFHIFSRRINLRFQYCYAFIFELCILETRISCDNSQKSSRPTNLHGNIKLRITMTRKVFIFKFIYFEMVEWV